MRLEEIKGKPVVSINEGEKLGIQARRSFPHRMSIGNNHRFFPPEKSERDMAADEAAAAENDVTRDGYLITPGTCASAKLKPAARAAKGSSRSSACKIVPSIGIGSGG